MRYISSLFSFYLLTSRLGTTTSDSKPSPGTSPSPTVHARASLRVEIKRFTAAADERSRCWRRFSSRRWWLLISGSSRWPVASYPLAIYITVYYSTVALVLPISTDVSGVVYNGSITPQVQSGVTKRTECRLYYRPSNKCDTLIHYCDTLLSGVG